MTCALALAESANAADMDTIIDAKGVLPQQPNPASSAIVRDAGGNIYTINTSMVDRGMLYIDGPDHQGLRVLIAPDKNVPFGYEALQDGWYPLKYGSGDYGVFFGKVGAHIQGVDAVFSFTATFPENAPFEYMDTKCVYAKDGPVAREAATLLNKYRAGGNDKVAKAVEASVNWHIRYHLDEDADSMEDNGFYPTADEIWETGLGACRHYASVAAAMLKSVGIASYITAGTVEDGSRHAWVSYLSDDGTWKCIDPTCPGVFASISPADTPEQMVF